MKYQLHEPKVLHILTRILQTRQVATFSFYGYLTKMKLGHQIAARRKQLEITAKTLAGRVGVSWQAVHKWETLESFPRQDKIPLIEKALSFELDVNEKMTSVELGLDDKPTESISSAPPRRREIARPLDAKQLGTFTADDLNLLMLICRLPDSAKNLIGALARLLLDSRESHVA